MIFSKTGINRMLANAGYLVATGKPIVGIRYLKKMVESLVLNKVTPRQIDIALTFDCNLQCDHCFSAPLHDPSKKEMSFQVLKKLAGDCEKLGITVIHFTGGEILLRKDLEEVIRIFNPRKNIIYIQSNGTLGSYERFRSLKKAGLDFFGASMEYPDRETQDQFRHYDGYFDKTLKMLETAKKAGLQTSVNITIDNRLIQSGELPAFIQMLGEKGHIVYGNLPVPVGRFKDKKDHLWLNNERKILNDLSKQFPFFRTEFDSNFGGDGCPAMKEKIYLCAYGDVLACPYIHISLGNIQEESLGDIYRRALGFNLFKTYHNHCLAAENRDFIETFIDKVEDYGQSPASYKHFEASLKSFSSAPPVPGIRMEKRNCPFCGSGHKEDIVTAPDYETDREENFSVVKCLSCGLVYTSPVVANEDLFRFFYDDDYLCYATSGSADAIRETYLCKSRFKEFQKILPEGGRYLDVGCAHGYFLDYLQKNTDWEAFGCEPNEKMAEIAAAKGLQVKASTLESAGYEDNFFDMVYMSHVLEHVPDPAATVREVYRILKPGGIFLTENPDFDSPLRPVFGKHWWGYHLPRHLTHFTHESIRAMIESSGLTVSRIKPCFRPGPIAWSIQNRLKERKAHPLLCSIFGLQNPFFVATMSFPTFYFLKKGHTEMMETLAIKP